MNDHMVAISIAFQYISRIITVPCYYWDIDTNSLPLNYWFSQSYAGSITFADITICCSVEGIVSHFRINTDELSNPRNSRTMIISPESRGDGTATFYTTLRCLTRSVNQLSWNLVWLTLELWKFAISFQDSDKTKSALCVTWYDYCAQERSIESSINLKKYLMSQKSCNPYLSASI